MVNGQWSMKLLAYTPNHSPFTVENLPFTIRFSRTQTYLQMGALWVRSPRNLWSSIGSHRANQNHISHLRRFLMKQIKSWKTLAIAAIFSLLVAAQPVVTYAGGCGSHTGC